MKIRQKALALGFERVGIARIGALPGSEHYREWLSQGLHGTMGYLEKVEPRMDPERLLPGARSVICVLKNYFTDAPQSRDRSDGVISRYAWGSDYHDVLRSRLEELQRFIVQETGAAAKSCVDTSAVLEKLWARQAGLGWQGKHTNLITRDLSSWVFLGEILVAAELEPDLPFSEDHCGSCQRCIDVCPTQAIVAPYVLDSRRCISYLTIELRGPIPRELRRKMGNLIFGCDLCQDVCPWNKYARVAADPEFHPRDGLQTPRLAPFMNLSEEEFRIRFHGSPILRARRSGFLRNVAVALGNSGSPESVPPLTVGLHDSDPLVRSHSAWGLGEIGTGEAHEVLRRRNSIEEDPGVREEIDLALRARPLNPVGPGDGPLNRPRIEPVPR